MCRVSARRPGGSNLLTRRGGMSMTKRDDDLGRLRVDTPCSTSWETMAGDGARRFCAECQREVYDFAQMTPRAIRARLAAHGGQLCARLTRRDGALVTAREPEIAAASRWA